VLAAAVSEAVLNLRALVLPPDAIAKAAHQDDEDGESEDADGDEAESEKVEQEGDDDSVSENMDPDEDQAGWGLGSGDADDGGWESGSVHSAADPDSSQSASEEVDSESHLEAPPAAKRAKPSPPKSTKPALAAKSSTTTTSQFLPSLAVGYIRGGSSDVDEDIDDEIKERKNRRGQRARQAIWEKKIRPWCKPQEEGSGRGRERTQSKRKGIECQRLGRTARCEEGAGTGKRCAKAGKAKAVATCREASRCPIDTQRHPAYEDGGRGRAAPVLGGEASAQGPDGR